MKRTKTSRRDWSRSCSNLELVIPRMRFIIIPGPHTLQQMVDALQQCVSISLHTHQAFALNRTKRRIPITPKVLAQPNDDV